MDQYIVSLLQSLGLPAALVLPAVVIAWLWREYVGLRHKRIEELARGETALRTGLSEQVDSLRKENHDLRSEIAQLSERVITLTDLVANLRDHVTVLKALLVEARVQVPTMVPIVVKQKDD